MRNACPGLALLLPLVGCLHDPVVDTGSSGPDSPDPVDGCIPGDGAAVDVSATLTEIQTVVRVTWHTDVPTDGVVHFTTATGPRETAPSSGTEHDVLLVGNRGNTEVPFRIVTDDGAGVTCGEVRTITTGALPSALPELTVTVDTPESVTSDSYTVAPIIQQVGAFVVLLDSGGQYVWAWSDPEWGMPGGYGGVYFNADLDLAGDGVYFNEQAATVDTPGALRHIAFDGTVLPSVDIEGGHTDFVQLPDGTIGALSWDIRDVGGTRYLGDRLLEVDPDGDVREVWNVWDHYTPDPDGEWPAGFYRADTAVLDWSHLNALGYDAAHDAWLVSMPFLQSVARIDRDTGQMAWILTGEPLVALPHSVQALGDNVLVFNRGTVSSPGACSRATEIAIDSATIVWSYEADPCLLVPFLGSAQRLPDGNTLVDWSSAGQLDEVSPTNEVVWQVNLALGAAFGFGERVPTLYPAE